MYTCPPFVSIPLSQASPVFNLLLFRIVHSRSLSLQLQVDVDYPVLILSLTLARVNYVHVYVTYIPREIEVIMCVRVRLCLNACVSRRMRDSW